MLLCLIDHPLISRELVGELVERFYESGKSIVLPVYKGRRGHPVIFASRLYEELLGAPPETGARAVVWAHREEVFEMETAEEGCVLNLNNPNALAKARARD
jgi:molybdenum cofactor cytidylyltransferase